MNKQRFKLLFLCTSNSARSIITEYLVKTFAGDRFDAVSAGASPKSHPNPLALKVLSSHYNIDVSDARSKSWDEFRDVNFDFVITLCDIAPCPVWPGQPIIAHWETPSPSDVEGTEKQKEDAVWKVTQQIKRRLELFWSLPFDKLDALRLEKATKEIGQKELVD
ncbi:MAG: arsenate reductase ArsC [Terrimicrobiaceae bacterium]